MSEARREEDMAAHFNAGRRLVALVMALAVCLSCAVAVRVGGPEERQRLEVRRHLKRLNKPPVKSIKVLGCAPFLEFLFIDFFFLSSFCSFSLLFCLLIWT